jgi:hypothetical protein
VPQLPMHAPVTDKWLPGEQVSQLLAPVLQVSVFFILF